ncbi:type VII secretion target [Saccharothrix deserti]|uniref:type VII secretion target n=1 Tax=Saccharothrix deserti TaxID=2593674 RepID=UPI00131A905B|nr:type VII secretion target [Saccharothrix deserti]
MTDRYEVAVEALTKHARSLEDRAAAASEALQAAMSVSVSDDAYGVICQFLPPHIDPVENEGVNALKAAVECLQEDAHDIRATASAYRSSDGTNAAGFTEGMAR